MTAVYLGMTAVYLGMTAVYLGMTEYRRASPAAAPPPGLKLWLQATLDPSLNAVSANDIDRRRRVVGGNWLGWIARHGGRVTGNRACDLCHFFHGIKTLAA